ncbi:hypothetical protein [Calidithermus roseus]|uniref:Uncharacterized protein n=1 Tax=Calidithermus roseus TaxID=1644118 RepID=A0A399F0D0_9DEIN|nr:hypothetical protein [Calidithermus roseus]RIH89430.1 hypothetical protein Mrose_00330 [Calidithermus roseus]
MEKIFPDDIRKQVREVPGAIQQPVEVAVFTPLETLLMLGTGGVR